MKNLTKRLSYVFYIVLVAFLFTGCHNIMNEKELVVEAVSIGNEQYKFAYKIHAFPVHQILYSNKVYTVGDTLRYCN